MTIGLRTSSEPRSPVVRPRPDRSRALSPAGAGFAALLLLVYAAPLFFPPTPVALGTVTRPDAWLLERIFPGVPPLWIAARLGALLAAALLLSRGSLSALGRSLRPATIARGDAAIRAARPIALAAAVAHALAAPWAARLGPAGQSAYVLALFVPALLLALPRSFVVRPQLRPSGTTLLAAAVILSWAALRLTTDLGSPRVADVIDGWRGWLDVLSFVGQRKNLLTDLFDPNLPGLGGVLFFLQGLPFFQSDLLALSFRSVQIFQILSLAACAAGVGVLARVLIGPGVAAIAVAVFLFAPYTRFLALFPGPFLAGPFYATAVALSAVLACRRHSEAALAALGACAGIAITFPGVVPTVAFFVAWTIWQLRGSWRALWVGGAAGLAAFAAAVVPALPEVLNPTLMTAHFRWDGLIAVIDGGLLGQLPLGSTAPAWLGVEPRPFDIVVAAVLAPFAHPRLAIRLWGDALFDPLGGALMAVGLAACARAALRSWVARVVLLFFGAALCPAFVSPVDIVDIVHAVVLPVPAALLAAAGFATVRRQLGWKLREAVVAAVAVCVGGTVLFDVVNPRILSASSFGIMFQVLGADDPDRVLVLSYGEAFVRPTKTLYTGPITAFAGRRPVGYLEYDGDELPASGFAAEGKNLLFWSHGFDADYPIADTICRQWPGATVYEIWDEARLGRVHAARVGGEAWEPRGADGRWRSRDCASRNAPVE